jgi:hypothetical protein
MELFTATGKLKKFFFFFFDMFDVFTIVYTALIDIIFMFLPHTHQHGYINILHCCNEPCLWVSEITWQWWDKYLVFDMSPKKKITGYNVRGPWGP